MARSHKPLISEYPLCVQGTGVFPGFTIMMEVGRV